MNQVSLENPLTSYLNERFDTLKTYFFNTLKFPAEEDIHQMRVEIKKLNALIRMLEFVADEVETKKLRKSLSKIFKAAGKLREAQIIENLAVEYQLDLGEDYKLISELKTTKFTEKFNIRLKLFLDSQWDDLQQQLTSIAQQINPKTTEQSASQFLIAEFKTIGQLYPDKHNEKVLHRIRRHLKASGYIISMISSAYPEEFYIKIKTTESLIGTWHDRIDFRQLLFKLIKRTSDTRKIVQIHKVLKMLEDDINKEVIEIHRQLFMLVENRPVLK